MEKSKVPFAHFVQENRFELHSYLTYLFNLIEDYFPEQKEDQMANQ